MNTEVVSTVHTVEKLLPKSAKKFTACEYNVPVYSEKFRPHQKNVIVVK